MNGLNKLGIALAVAFSVLVVAILAEICYVFFRRRKFRQRNRVEDDSERFPSTGPVSNPPSKELLLYYLCWRTQTPIEPEGYPTIRVLPDAPPVADEGDALKWQGLYGPSRFLFTIKEEAEREEADSSAEKMTTTTRVVSLEEECFAFGSTVDDATPFSTPCGSPFYYTPAASPAREVENGGGGENLPESQGNDVTVSPDGISGGSTASYVTLKVYGN